MSEMKFYKINQVGTYLPTSLIKSNDNIIFSSTLDEMFRVGVSRRQSCIPTYLHAYKFQFAYSMSFISNCTRPKLNPWKL